MSRNIVLTSIALIFLAIVLGAFGAHALKELVTLEKLNSFETGVRYQMFGGLALLILGLNADRFSFSLRPFFRLNLIGIVLFSVSIYFLALQEVVGISFRFLGPVTPLGGLLLIVSWALLFFQLFRSRS